MTYRSDKFESLLNVVLEDCETASYVARRVQECRGMLKRSELKDLTDSQYAKVEAMLEMNRCNVVAEPKGIFSPEDVMPYLSDLKYKEQEHFVVISLDAASHVKKRHVVTKGLVDKTPVHPRECFRPAIIDNASAVIFAHNHPSGSCDPSMEDYAITRTLCCAGKVLQIPVIDHIIVSRCGHTSMCRKTPEIFEQTFNYEIGDA